MKAAPLLEDKKPMSQFLVLLAFVLISVVLFAMASLLISMPLYGINILEPGVLERYDDPNVVKALKFMQFWQAFGLFIVPPVAWLYLVTRNKLAWVKLNRAPGLLLGFLSLLFIVSAQPVIGFIAELNGKMELPGFLEGLETWMKTTEAKAGELTKAFLVMQGPGELLLNLLIVALLPAIGEELLFRGALQPLLIRITKNKHWGIWLSAILFSAMHMQFYGFIPRMLLGAAFGYMVSWSNNLWLPIIAHFVNNALAVVLAYFIGIGAAEASVENAGADNAALVALGFVLVAGILYLFRMQGRKRGSTEIAEV